ncbi:proline--tRNA ligase [Patescibacteria group bacterium]|nr:proline--tRNA ligase [Patescibacteria group bacterium]MCL5091828.1 proline--tRNA ligase [Patescibacteria group bacterium]
MRYSQLFGKTIKTAPSDAVNRSHLLLYQAGYIRESTAGRYFFLPLGQLVQQRIIAIIKEEMDRSGAQEMLAPVLHPLELWKETNRTNTTGFELMKVKDRRGAEFALGGTAEEMFVDVVRKMCLSYRDLPLNLYQFSTKFRDELRARGGLLRVREFIMKDAYSFDQDETTFKKSYQLMAEVYRKIFSRLGLDTMMVESDNGYIGGEYCHEFVVESPVGETRFLTTADGQYAAHEEVAVFHKDNKNPADPLQPLKEVEAARGTTMEDGQKLHQLPLWQQIKDVLFVDEKERYILAIIRGDYDVNEIKLKHQVDAITLRHATDEEIRGRLHSEPGFISPVNIKKLADPQLKLIIVADDSLRTIKNAYGGGNKKNRDLINMNIDRDYRGDIEADIALAQGGYTTADKRQKLHLKRGIEVGNIFQLGYHYSKKMRGATFVDQNGKSRPYYMGCYGIGIGRTLAAIVEAHNDKHGIIWPETVAPYQCHLLGLDRQDENAKKQADAVYRQFTEAGITVLYDDRDDVRAGVKFADADLIGLPLRLVVSKKTNTQIELKKRTETVTQLMSTDDCIKFIEANRS